MNLLKYNCPLSVDVGFVYIVFGIIKYIYNKHKTIK